MAVGVYAGEVSQDPVRGVRDEDRVVVCQERAVAADEVQEVGHLLKVGWHVRVVAQEMHVVEDEVDNMLDVALGRIKMTPTRGRRHNSMWGEGQQPKRSHCHKGRDCMLAAPFRPCK